jgi:hypothetical protein
MLKIDIFIEDGSAKNNLTLPESAKRDYKNSKFNFRTPERTTSVFLPFKIF